MQKKKGKYIKKSKYIKISELNETIVQITNAAISDKLANKVVNRLGYLIDERIIEVLDSKVYKEKLRKDSEHFLNQAVKKKMEVIFYEFFRLYIEDKVEKEIKHFCNREFYKKVRNLKNSIAKDVKDDILQDNFWFIMKLKIKRFFRRNV